MILHRENCAGYSFVKELLAFVFLLCICQSTSCSQWIDGTPKPKEIVISSDGIAFVGNSTKVFVAPLIQAQYPVPFLQFKRIVKGMPRSRQFVERVDFLLVSVKSLANYISGDALVLLLASDEGYLILSRNRKISVISNTPFGLLRGCETLQSLIVTNHGEVHDMQIIDYPDLRTRALHFAFRNGDTFVSAKNLISKARLQHFNTIIVLIDGLSFFKNSRSYSENSDYRQQVKMIVKFARDNGIEVIPEVKLLTKQKYWFLKVEYPDLMLNSETYNPARPAIYQIVFSVLDMIISEINPKTIHIGHDEVFGIVYDSRRQLKDEEVVLSYDSFLYDIEKVNSYLQIRNIEVMMWGDMLVAKKEFPEMDSLPLHGDTWRESLVNRVPENIIICDWHYFDDQAEFPSAQNFANQGYQVMGATWGEIDKGRHRIKTMETIKNFSRYMASLKKNNKGMIATTWYSIASREREDLISQIVEVSGNAFWNARLR